MSNDVEKTIGGRRFRFGLLPADRGFKVLMMVLRNLGGPLAELAGGVGKKVTKSDLQAISAKLLGSVFFKINDDEIRTAMEELFSVTACLDQAKTGKVTLVDTFQGRLLDAFKVAIEAFKVNYADFLAGVLSLSNPETAATTSPSPNLEPSPTPTTYPPSSPPI
jgi:hypothetical protein